MIRMNHRLGTLGLLGALALLTGCDDDKLPPPPGPPPADPVPSRPTTQALLDGPRKPVYLELIPFSLDVPDSWKLVPKNKGESTSLWVLEGPMPYEDGLISVHMREPVSAAILKIWLEERIPKDDAEARARGGSVTTRRMGDIQIIERRVPFAPTTRPTTTPSGPTTIPVSIAEGSMEWKLTILAPRGIKYDCYELKVLSLTDDLYRKNEAFLTSVLHSLKPATPAALPPM